MSAKRATGFLAIAAIGALCFGILEFSMGWVVTSGRAHADAEQMSMDAVKDELVPICIYQFNADDDSAKRLKELKGLQEWEREKFVSDKGWATMPGSESPVSGIAQQCARRLVQSTS